MGRKAMPRHRSLGRSTRDGRQRRRSGGSVPAERRQWHAARMDQLQSMFPAWNTRLDEEIGQRRRRRGDSIVSLTLIHILYYFIVVCRTKERPNGLENSGWITISGNFADASRIELTCILVDVVNANQLELTAGYTSKKLECIRQIDTMRVDTVVRDIKPLINRLLCTQLTPLYPSLVTVVYSSNKLTSVHAKRFPSESNRNESNLGRVNFFRILRKLTKCTLKKVKEKNEKSLFCVCVSLFQQNRTNW